MMDVGRHPRIQTFVGSEVEEVSGFVGNYRARIRKHPRYVVAGECTSCGECSKVCPVVVPDEYQQGLSSRKAIYLPFPQAVPSSYALDMKACLGNEPIACGRCLDVCDKKCIDFDMLSEVVEVPVGAIVLATGMEVYDPRENDEYGYTRYANVISSPEFERLICAGGPTGGHLVRPSDRQTPKRIGFIQCVGSRSNGHGASYCSNICCLNTIKETLQIHEHYPDAESTVFYMDIRAFGKGFEEIYSRSREAGVRYVRGLPGLVEEDPKSRDLVVHVENTTTGKLERHQLDMVVLAVGFLPRKANGDGSADLHQLLTLSHTSEGLVMEAHPKLKPVDAPTRGIYFAGCVEAPKDIKDSVTQAGAAAMRAGNLLSAGQVKVEAITALFDSADCNFCGRCARCCPFNAVTMPNKKEGRYPEFIEAACAGCGTCAAECPSDSISMRHFTDMQLMAQVDAILSERPMEKVVAFACNWCSYAGGDTAGTSRLQYPPTVRLIRTMCSGRVDEKFIWHAFRQGAPMVLVSGCHFSDCHYIDAVTWTQKRIEKVWSQMEKLGIRPARLQLEWISAAEGQKFARVMKALDGLLKKVTPEEVEETKKILEEQAKKEQAKKAKKKAKPGPKPLPAAAASAEPA
jgi:heterodisulfide reductase subunit A